MIFPHFDSRTWSSFKFSSKLVTFTDPHVPPTNVICFAVLLDTRAHYLKQAATAVAIVVVLVVELMDT